MNKFTGIVSSAVHCPQSAFGTWLFPVSRSPVPSFSLAVPHFLLAVPSFLLARSQFLVRCSWFPVSPFPVSHKPLVPFPVGGYPWYDLFVVGCAGPPLMPLFRVAVHVPLECSLCRPFYYIDRFWSVPICISSHIDCDWVPSLSSVLGRF